MLIDIKTHFPWVQQKSLTINVSLFQSDFMTLELVDRHVQFSWDMGGGARTIVHPLTVESASEKEKEEEKWYKVIVER